MLQKRIVSFQNRQYHPSTKLMLEVGPERTWLSVHSVPGTLDYALEIAALNDLHVQSFTGGIPHTVGVVRSSLEFQYVDSLSMSNADAEHYILPFVQCGPVAVPSPVVH